MYHQENRLPLGSSLCEIAQKARTEGKNVWEGALLVIRNVLVCLHFVKSFGCFLVCFYSGLTCTFVRKSSFGVFA